MEQSNPNIQNNNDNNEQKDGVTTVELNDAANNHNRPGTTVIHLHEQSEKDIDYANNVKRKKKNGKELSRIPYTLDRLHNRSNMMDVLRVTKLRDLFAVSYVFRYILCVIIGCASFFTLAFLWKLVFRINTCHIEGANRQFKYMPFAYGFMVAFKNGLLVSVPLLHVLLPTVGVTHKHRTRFIFAFLLIIFTVFTCYGFYGLDWSTYSYVASAILGVLALTIFFYWGGYFAFWVIFPLFSAAFFAMLIMALMKEYVWTFINSHPNIFGIFYPLYLTILQQITFKCMLWFRLPYKIRQCCSGCFPQWCCKTDVNGQTPVYYENYSNVWLPSTYDLKYSQKRISNGLELETKPNDVGKHENTDTTIINKAKSGESAHRYRSTELELTVEDVWSQDILFVAGGTVIVFIESMRVAGMVALKDDIAALILNVVSSIMLECLSRNNLYWEFIYKCCLKKANPGLTRFYSSVLGTRYQTEYIPYFVICMMNLTKFGPSDSCRMRYLGTTVSMGFRQYWWVYVILFVSEMLSDLVADWFKKIGRKKGWLGDEENGDPAREATYLKLRPWMMVCLFIGFFVISLLAYEIDYDAKTIMNV